MNREDIMKLEAGRELDNMIHEKIMDKDRVNRRGTLWWQERYSNGEPYWYIDAPEYSTDYNHAFQVIAILEQKEIWFEISDVIPNSDPIVYEIKLSGKGVDVYACEDTIPVAICRAALLAVMGAE